MARFKLVALAGLGLALTACEPKPGPVVVAPRPAEYTCQQSRQAADEFDALPAGSMLRVYVTDYGRLRRALRAVLGLPEPAKCPAMEKS